MKAYYRPTTSKNISGSYPAVQLEFGSETKPLNSYMINYFLN